MKHKIFITAIAIILAAGCGGKQEKKAVPMGPEDTVEMFCRALAGGDFETAMSLCDTLTMKGYIDRYADVWDLLTRQDSGATAIAAASLAEADFTVDGITRDGDRRTVTYTIAAGEGMDKKKIATVRKEEGEWKVEKITDSL